MVFLMTFVLAAVASLLLRPAVKKAPWAWYALAALLVVSYLAGVSGSLPSWMKSAVFLLMQKGTLATALFAVVMFVGVFPESSAVRARLAPIRAELSIVACILVLGHVVAYGMSFVPRVLSAASLSVPVALGLAAALVLLILLVVLGITSFGAVKARMAAKTWKKVQRWAYVFYGLIYVHALAMLLPSAASGGEQAIRSVVAYTAVFGIYAIARAARALTDRKARLVTEGSSSTLL